MRAPRDIAYNIEACFSNFSTCQSNPLNDLPLLINIDTDIKFPKKAEEKVSFGVYQDVYINKIANIRT